jgi:lipid-A-disaccharide synthase
VSPQIWAWRSGRVRQLRKLVDHIAVILPFEEAFYRAHGVPVTFVGHPLLEDLPPLRPIAEPPKGGEIVVGLLPGSRSREVARHLPVMLDAAALLHARCKHAKFIVSRAASVADEFFEPLYRRPGPRLGSVTVAEGVETVLRECHVVVVASGTATLEAALHAVPMVIIYKVSRLTYWIGRMMIRVRNIGLVNLVAGKNLAPELINDDASPAGIARAVTELIADPSAYAALCGELAVLRERLGGPGATGRVADLALGMLAQAGRGQR